LTFGLYISVVIYLDIFIYSVRRLFFFYVNPVNIFGVLFVSADTIIHIMLHLPSMYIEIFFICCSASRIFVASFRYHRANLSLSDIMVHFLVKLYIYYVIQNKAQTSLLIISLNSVCKLTVTVWVT
jgi:hypothetical protein